MLTNNQEIVAALYLAYFDRPAEPEGLAYWTGQLASGKTIFDIAAGFSTTREARELYPDLRDDHVSNIDAFLYKSFNNIFNRSPTAADTSYWVPAIENGKPASQVLVELITSAQGGDVLKLDNTIDVSLYFTEQADDSSKQFDVAAARELINDVGYGHEAVNQAELEVDRYFHPETQAQQPGPSSLFRNGQIISISHDYPGIGNHIGPVQDSTIQSGSEGNFIFGSFADFKAEIEINANVIAFDFDFQANFTTEVFNGIHISDRGDQFRDFSAVTVESNITGLEIADFTFDSNNIYVNLAGLSVTADSDLTLTFGV